jgi:hypothetical protein
MEKPKELLRYFITMVEYCKQIIAGRFEVWYDNRKEDNYGEGSATGYIRKIDLHDGY